VAVGITGFALMQLKEEFIDPPHGAPEKCECVKNDIDQLGFEDWVDCHLDDVPTEPGTYAFAGKADFDEDTANYSATCLNI
jgi:hypothetical protein